MLADDQFFSDNIVMRAEHAAYTYENDELHPTPTLGEVALTADSMKQYLAEIGRIPLLTAEQEVELAKRIEAGLYAEHLLDSDSFEMSAMQEELEWLAEDGRQANHEMINANTRLVVSIAKKNHNTTMGLLDRIQEGNMGLVHAVKKFDYKKGFKFSTYATYWIKQSIDRGVANQGGTIRLPVHVHERIKKALRVASNLYHDTMREPTIEEIAQKMETSADDIVALFEHNRTVLSLDMPLGSDESFSLTDTISNRADVSLDDSALAALDKQALGQALDALLTEKDADIIRSRYGLITDRVQTLDEVADRYDVTRERVRQLQSEIIKKLARHIIKDEDSFIINDTARDDHEKISKSLRKRTRRERIKNQLQVAGNQVNAEDREILTEFINTSSLRVAAQKFNVSQREFCRRTNQAELALKAAVEQAQ